MGCNAETAPQGAGLPQRFGVMKRSDNGAARTAFFADERLVQRCRRMATTENIETTRRLKMAVPVVFKLPGFPTVFGVRGNLGGSRQAVMLLFFNCTSIAIRGHSGVGQPVFEQSKTRICDSKSFRDDANRSRCFTLRRPPSWRDARCMRVEYASLDMYINRRRPLPR